MAEDIVLYEGQLTTTSTLVKTIDAHRQVRVTAISLVNITGTAATARIDRVPSGGTSTARPRRSTTGSVGANVPRWICRPVAKWVVVELHGGDQLWVSIWHRPRRSTAPSAAKPKRSRPVTVVD